MPIGEVAFPIVGTWSASNQAFSNCFGTLNRDDAGSLRLELAGRDAGTIRASFSNPEFSVWGDTEKYRRITLLNCFFRKGPPVNLGGPSFHTAEVVVNEVVLGMHLKTDAEKVVTHCVVESQAVLDWASEKLLSIDKKKGFGKPSLKVGRGRKLSVKTGGWTMSVRPDFTYSVLETEAGAFNITHRAQAAIAFETPQSLRQTMQTVRKIEALFAFLSSNFAAKPLIFLTATPLNGVHRSGLLLPSSRYKALGEPVDPWHRLAPRYVCTPATTGKLLRNWFRQNPKIELAFDFYRSYMETRIFTAARFQTVVQALEILHRETDKGALTTRKRAEKLRKTMLGVLPSNIPEELHDKIATMLDYVAELSLRHRLRSLVDAFPYVLPNESDSKKIVSRIVETRNRLVHGGLKEAQLAQIPELTMICGALFETKMLSTLGVAAHEVKMLYSRNQDALRRPDWSRN